jgi:AraC-like DNA-binding protein
MNTKHTRPKLYIWKNSRLYIGTNRTHFRKHTLAWSQLIVSVHGKIRIKFDHGTEEVTRSCLLKAGTSIDVSKVDTSNAVVAIYFLNPISQDFFILQNQMIPASKGVYYNHTSEDNLIQQFRHIMSESIQPNQACQLCQQAVVEPRLRQIIVKEFDPRIIETLQNIRESFSTTLSVGKYAADVHLSESRLNKLFKDQIGIPITKYRLQIRLSIGIILLAEGYSVTSAAYEAGFSSAAHFSTCFSDMIGIQPSTTFLKSPFMDTFISDDVLEYIHSITASNACY